MSIQERTFFTTATTARGPDGTVVQPSGLLVLFMGHAVTRVVPCCKLLDKYPRLNSIESVVTHASLALFSRRTNTSSVLHALRAYFFCCCCCCCCCCCYCCYSNVGQHLDKISANAMLQSKVDELYRGRKQSVKLLF